jgi:hypothetical protein
MSRYDGLDKLWTKDCDDCPYRQEQQCRWGVAIKRLLKADDRMRHCEYRHRQPPERSAYLENRILIRKGRSQVSREARQGALF